MIKLSLLGRASYVVIYCSHSLQFIFSAVSRRKSGEAVTGGIQSKRPLAEQMVFFLLFLNISFLALKSHHEGTHTTSSAGTLFLLCNFYFVDALIQVVGFLLDGVDLLKQIRLGIVGVCIFEVLLLDHGPGAHKLLEGGLVTAFRNVCTVGKGKLTIKLRLFQ